MDYPVTFATGERNQVHHSYIWLGPLTAAMAALFAAVVYNVPSLIKLGEFLELLGYPSILLMLLGALVLYGVIYAIVTIIYVLAWRNLSYVFDPTEFSLYSGVITKRHVHVPYARVQSVNHHAGLVQRLFGVCSVSIDTAGGSSNKAVKVPYVTLDVAERIRSDLFVRKAAVVADCADRVRLVESPAQAPSAGNWDAGLPGMGDQPIPPGMGGRPLSPSPGAQPSASAAGAQPNLLDDVSASAAQWRGAFSMAAPGMESATFEAGLDDSQLLLTGTTALATEGAVVSLGITGAVLGIMANAQIMEPWMAGSGLFLALAMLVLGLVAGVVGTVLSYGQFRVRRRGSRVEVERGLLQRVFTGIDIDRIQSVVVRQSFVRRCLGYCEVSLGRINTSADKAGNSNKQALNQAGLVVHPFLRIDQVEAFLGQLLPEFADMPRAAEVAPLPAVALRRGLLRNGIWRNAALWSAVAYALMQVLLHGAFARPSSGADALLALMIVDQIGAVLYALAALGTIAALVHTVLWRKGSGHVLADRYVGIRNDGLHTDFTVIPRNKVQSGCTRTNPFQNAAQVTTLCATTAAGDPRSTTVLWDVTAGQGTQWLDWLKPRYAAASDSQCGF